MAQLYLEVDVTSTKYHLKDYQMVTPFLKSEVHRKIYGRETGITKI